MLLLYVQLKASHSASTAIGAVVDYVVNLAEDPGENRLFTIESTMVSYSYSQVSLESVR